MDATIFTILHVLTMLSVADLFLFTEILRPCVNSSTAVGRVGTFDA
jgi:hypothetical protein